MPDEKKEDKEEKKSPVSGLTNTDGGSPMRKSVSPDEAKREIIRQIVEEGKKDNRGGQERT